MRVFIVSLIVFSLVIQGIVPSQSRDTEGLKYLIFMIGDGMGENHLQAAKSYTGVKPEYQNWSRYWVSTYSVNGSYDPQSFWNEFDYALTNYTDSAAAATALFSGVKTANGRISVNADGSQRLQTIADLARAKGKAVGAVTTVYLSHATPGAWYAHNLHRTNGYATADEGLWGDPNTTGESGQAYYGGGQGPTHPPLDVLMGSGHPDWEGSNYINQNILAKLRQDVEDQHEFKLVERIAGLQNAGFRLNDIASDPSTRRLIGLFGGPGGNLEYRLADGSGHNPENPSLSEMTSAALQVLSRDEQGFVLLVEGGAIDWASHLNDMNRTLGEQIAFNQAVDIVSDWVEDPSNESTWSNTLVVVTADHETGYLTAGPGEFPDRALGLVTNNALSLEKEYSDSGHRASWEDADGDSNIDPGEHVFWAWNTGGHSNSLVPLFARGIGSEKMSGYFQGIDPVRGAYIDNTAVHSVIKEMLKDLPIPTPNPTENPNPMNLFLPFLQR